MFTPLCQSTHGNLIAGKCPWCGRVVVGGRAFENDTQVALAITGLSQASENELPPWTGATESLLAIIEQINRGAIRAIPLLIASLRDPHEAVREAAANALGRLGRDARDALPTLVILLDDTESLVRDAAREAIAKIERAE